MWLLYALLSPLFWAIVHLLDWYCVEELFEQPWMGAITSSLASCSIFLFLPFLNTNILSAYGIWELPNFEVIAIAILIGILIQTSQVFYFQALSYSEVGIIAAYWNITPTVLPIASFLLFGKVLQVHHYFGIATLVLVSIGFCLLDANFKTRWKALHLMILACLIQAVALLLEEYVFDRSSFFTVFLLITLGIIMSGFLPLLIRSVRLPLLQALVKMRGGILILLAIELINLAALFMSQRAVALGIPSLVAAVEATIPAYTFILSATLYRLNLPLHDHKVMHHLPFKVLLLGFMMVGILLIS